MKKTFKQLCYALALCITALFTNCEKADETITTTQIPAGTGTTNLVAFDEVLAGLQNNDIKRSLIGMQNTARQKNTNSGFGDLKYFTKFEYTDYTIYSLYVSEYTDSRPYFLYYTIEVNNQTREEKSGFLKFVPQVKIQELVVKTFTGQLHLIDNDDNLLGGATFNNGNMTSNSLGGITTCTTTIVMVSHPCSNGGNHGIGETCDPGFQNDAHMSFQFFTDCKTTFPTYGGGGGGTGGGGGGGGGISYTQGFYNGLNQQQQQFLDANPNVKNDVYNYISSYGSYTDIAKNTINYMIATNNIALGTKLLNFFRGVAGRNDQNFAQQILDKLNEAPLPVYNTSNYPGKDKGMPFEWWNDKAYITNNLKMPIKMPAPVEGKPNAREVFVFALWPVEAMLHIENATEASDRAYELATETNSTLTHLHNGKADAFRHAYWNALDTAEFGAKVTKIFTDAHEWNADNHPLETQMDLYNNARGREMAANYNIFTTDLAIEIMVLYQLSGGTLKYLAPLGSQGQILQNTQIKFTNQ